MFLSVFKFSRLILLLIICKQIYSTFKVVLWWNLPLEFLDVSHRIPWRNKSAVNCLQISTLVPEIFMFLSQNVCRWWITDTFLLCFRFMEPLVIIILGGVLPFGSIFIEMWATQLDYSVTVYHYLDSLFLFYLGRYFIFTSFWAYKIYYVFGFMFLVFLILAIVTVCVTIVCTYFLLNAEDYRWWVTK